MDMDMVVVHIDHEEGLDTHMDVVKNHNCPLIKTTTITTQNWIELFISWTSRFDLSCKRVTPQMELTQRILIAHGRMKHRFDGKLLRLMMVIPIHGKKELMWKRRFLWEVREGKGLWFGRFNEKGEDALQLQLQLQRMRWEWIYRFFSFITHYT